MTGMSGRLRSLEDLPDVAAGLAVHPADVRAVAHQQARHCELARERDRRERIALGKRGDLLAAVEQYRVGRRDHGVDPGAQELRERGVDLGGIARILHNDLQSDRGRTFLRVRLLGHDVGIVRVHQQPDARDPGREIMQQLHALGAELVR